MGVTTVKPNGKRILEVRKQLGLSHADVVARMPRHRHPKTIDIIERGGYHVGETSLLMVQQIADALGQPVDEFIIKTDADEAA